MGAGAEQADVDLRRPEPGVLGCDQDVAAGREGDPGAERRAVDGADDRDGTVHDRPHGVAGRAARIGDRPGAQGLGRRLLVDGLEVDAGHERLASGCGEDGHPHLTVGAESHEGVAQLGHRRPRDGVHRRSVQGDGGDVILELDGDVGHNARSIPSNG